jgi:hypothetical protein
LLCDPFSSAPERAESTLNLPKDGIWVLARSILSVVPDTIQVSLVSSTISCQRFDSDHRAYCDAHGWVGHLGHEREINSFEHGPVQYNSQCGGIPQKDSAWCSPIRVVRRSLAPEPELTQQIHFGRLL